MSTITITPQSVDPPDIEAPAVFPWRLHRMSLEQYDALVESGIFTERDRLQLINGILVAKVIRAMIIALPTSSAGRTPAVLPPGWFVRSNKPVDIPPDSEPEPEQAVIRGSNRDYAQCGEARPQDVALIVEIAPPACPRTGRWSESTARRHPVYWIVNLVDRQVEVYSAPARLRDARCLPLRSHVPVVIDGVVVGQIAVDDLLP